MILKSYEQCYTFNVYVLLRGLDLAICKTWNSYPHVLLCILRTPCKREKCIFKFDKIWGKNSKSIELFQYLSFQKSLLS